MKNIIERFVKRDDESGFSLLELVVAIGIILILTVGGLIGYGAVRENAKEAASEKAASDVMTAAMVYDHDLDSNGSEVEDAGNVWNDSAKDSTIVAESKVVTENGQNCIRVTATHRDGYVAERTGGCETPAGSGGNETVDANCAVPSGDNVYPLAEFPKNESTDTHMIIVPVVNNGDFGGNGSVGQLGLKAWSCGDSQLSSDNSLKVTAWSNTSTMGEMFYNSGVGEKKFSNLRLDPENGYGKDIAKIHRNGSTDLLGADVTGNDRDRYSWLISSGRDNSNTAADPSCLTGMCNLRIDPFPSFDNAFNNNGEDEATSVEYLAEWSKNEGMMKARSVNPTVLDSYTGSETLSSTDGKQVRWVVMEWTGTDAPSDDMALELFVQ